MNTETYTSIIKKILWIFGVAVVLSPSLTQASELYVETIPTKPRAGEELIATLYIDTEGEVINAVEGSISFSQNLEPIHVYHGSSFIPLWLKKPEIQGDKIVYAGVIPGGFQGRLSSQWEGYRPGALFTVVFIAREVGDAWIQVDRGTMVLLHDGNATEDRVIVVDNDFEVREASDDLDTSETEGLEWDDNEPPEMFTPIVVKYPNKTFGGVWQVVFVAQDARSGIAYYEVKEGDRGFVRAESPYRLQAQDRSVDITVRAVDQAGNMREVVIPKAGDRAWYNMLWVRGMLAVTLSVVIIILLIRIYRKKS